MKQFFKKLFCKQNNPSDTNQSVVPEALDNLSEYDKQMIEKYQNQIQDGTLILYRDPDLKSLYFIRLLKLNILVLECCCNIIPKLESSTIKKLEITNCGIQSAKDFQLENLEVLGVFNFDDYLELNALAKEIVQFKKLKELALQQCITDYSPLAQMTGLTELSLQTCELRSTETLKPLINLEKLYLNYNKDIDITTLQYLTNLTYLSLVSSNLVRLDALKPLVNLKVLYLDVNEDIDITALQYLTNLTILQLAYCNLVNIDALRPLKKLEELSIYDNKIVYLQPLMELRQLSKLYVRDNRIMDTESIQLHPNFNSFILDNQNEPTKEELQTANIMKDINNQISSLKQICKVSQNIKDLNTVFRQNINQQLQDSYNNHEQLLTRAAKLFQKMNAFDSYQ
ncbi:Leucine_Rich Repeat domain protein [Hexamita inflata]|uniref:Leucine Rich Repeat domain protein n=1 Tax=Hexamita inflata TaxID=28002 RepID=A0AA86PV62_9EUKA|nr:Leucine Rich Repeat domain protein [Hexamita inflata]CAI9944752.1 Leucine Rich Repeat domain protein [Hexamita inflata]